MAISITEDGVVVYENEPDINRELFPNLNGCCTELRTEIDELKENFDDMVMAKYNYAEPINWFDFTTITMGELLANGSVQASTTRFYTDFIPVSGWVRARFFRGDSLATVYRRHVACYDLEKNLVGGGSDSAGSTFAVPSGVAYIRITFDYDANISRLLMVTNDLTPNAYSAYFPPHWAIASDFLTEESKNAIDRVINGELSPDDLANNYGCSLPVSVLRQTVGIDEQFYLRTARTPDETTFLNMAVGLDQSERNANGVYLPNDAAYVSVNGFYWYLYDYAFNEIQRFVGAGSGGQRCFVNENLSDCSLIVIGDSTVDHDVMTAKILEHFENAGKTVTLLGTLGSEANRNEGRAGWKATDYLTNRAYNGAINPFYNPTTKTFDFAYYMANQGYTAPDFAVVQLGINDLGDNKQTYQNIWNAIKIIIDSIKSFNSATKVILNLPTTPTSNQNNITAFLPRYKNRVVSYDQFAIEHSLAEYGENSVRCSYCHLILDPDADIRDNVHPTNVGYEKMALELVNQINCWQNGF